MKSRNLQLVVLFAFLALNIPRAWAPSPLPDYSIEASDEVSSVAITLTLSQNITAFEASFSVPEIRGTIQGTDSSSAVEAVQNALRVKSPRAEVSNLTLSIESSPWSNATNLQWFNVSLSMDISGVSAVRSGVAEIDLSWKSFAVSSPISMGGVEVNNIGQSLLFEVANDLAGLAGTDTIQFFYFAMDKEVGRAFFPTAVRGLSALDFSAFVAPLSQWQMAYIPLAGTNIWTLDPETAWGMKMIQQITEGPFAVERLTYGIWSRVTGKITAPSSFSVEGDTIKVVLDSFPEALMGSGILLVALIGFGIAVYERRILKGSVKKKPKH